MVPRTSRLRLTLMLLLVALLAVPSVVTAPVQAGPMRVTQVTVKDFGTRLVVGIVATGQILFSITEIETPLPPRVAIDILNAIADDRVRLAKEVKRGKVLRVRVGQFQDNPAIARVVVDLVRPVRVDVQRSAPNILAVGVPLLPGTGAEATATVSAPILTREGPMTPAVSAAPGTGLIRTAQQPLVPGAPAGPGLIKLLEFRGVALSDVLTALSKLCGFNLMTGTSAQHEEVVKVLGSLDIKIPQVVIQVNVVEINTTAERKLGLLNGVNSGIGTGAGFGNVVLDSANRRISFTLTDASLLNFALQALINEGNARILTAPRVATLDGNKATIVLGQKIPVFTSTTVGGQLQTTVSYQDVGVKLVTTPRVNTDELITLALTPEVSTLGAQVTSGSQQAFIVNTRNADTVLTVADGKTIALGGLIDRSERTSIIKLPLLGDIPILGELFRSSDTTASETEVIFLITPQIVKD